jgi:hypothetical protein
MIFANHLEREHFSSMAIGIGIRGARKVQDLIPFEFRLNLPSSSKFIHATIVDIQSMAFAKFEFKKPELPPEFLNNKDSTVEKKLSVLD